MSRRGSRSSFAGSKEGSSVTSSIPQKTIVTSPMLPSLEAFTEHFRYTNPFDENRVTQTDSLANDVPAIHADAFEQLTIRARKASQNTEMGCGVVVTGSPGVGKSHLLARFGEWARREKYPFVYLLNLQAGPNDILRTILRTSISILTKGLDRSPHQTRLYRLVSATINQALIEQKISQAVDLPTAHQAYQALLDRLDGNVSIYKVMWLFFEDIFRRANGKPRSGKAELAKRWLSGGYLDPDEARRLELNVSSTAEDGCSLDLEQMKEVLKILCQFAGFRQRSLILCFDQVDTLTEDQVQSWSATTHALLDSCPRLLAVTSGVDDTFIEWTRQKLMPPSSWDRIRQFSIHLSGINADAARTMVQDRLDSSLAGFDSLSEIYDLRRRQHLFPLGDQWERQTLFDEQGETKSDLRPRTVINQAGSGWDRESAALNRLGLNRWMDSWPHEACGSRDISETPQIDLRTLIDQRVVTKLEEHRQSRLLRPEELPVDAGNVVGLLTSILKSCEKAGLPFRHEQYSRFGGFFVSSSKSRKKPAFQIVLEQLPEMSDGTRRTIGVTIAEASSGNAATNMLKRIVTELEAPNGPDRAMLVVDARDPLQLADTGQACLEKLTSQPGRFTLEMFDFEQYATLDAYEAVVGLARSGDLEALLPDGTSRPISEAEVYESHHRTQRYLGPAVLCQLIGKCTHLALPNVPDIDLQRILEATYAQLAMNSILTTLQLTSSWIEHQRPRPDESCRAAVHNMFKEVVLKLHAEGKVFATALNDYYTVQPTKKLLDGSK